MTALQLCRTADAVADGERQRLLRRGLALAEAAVGADQCNATAHLAVFCNLGKQIESRGVGLADLSSLHRLNREIDTALALAPHNADVLAAKGAMLVKLPKFFGGDARHGEALLREALVRDPLNDQARRYLTELSSD